MRRFCVILTFLVLTTAVLTAIFCARRTQFWYDEVLTVATASQGSLQGIWTALTYGADANPPLFYVVERGASRFFSDPEVGFRICSIVGLVIAVSAMFFFALPRIGPVGASIVSVSLLLTTLYRDYTIDARPYVMVSGCVALALLAWQRADRRPAVIILGILCLLAESLRYYAIYAIAAIAFGEAVGACGFDDSGRWSGWPSRLPSSRRSFVGHCSCEPERCTAGISGHNRVWRMFWRI